MEGRAGSALRARRKKRRGLRSISFCLVTPDLAPLPSEMTKRDVPGFAIGGLSGGESKSQFWRMVALSTSRLPKDKPRYLMGVGYVEGRGDSPAYGKWVPGDPCLWGTGGEDPALPRRGPRRTWLSARDGSEGAGLGGGECEGWVSGFGVCDQGLRFSAPLPHGPTPSYATDLVVCVALGCDMFDCVFPTRTAVRPLAGERPARDWGSQGGG